MEVNTTEQFVENNELESLQRLIKDRLKVNMSGEFYETWVEHFVFEKIKGKKVVIGYYGETSLKQFDKIDKKLVLEQISSVVGKVKKLKICKRKNPTVVNQNSKLKKNLRVLKLLIVSMIFLAFAFSLGLIACNYIGNRNFRETFYSVSSLKVNNMVRIIQISDLHGCSYGEENQKLLSRIEKLAPDVILCTGDMFDSETKDSVETVVSLCTGLAKVAPTYYVYGNNEAEQVYDFPLNETELDKKFGFSVQNRDPSQLISLKDELEKKIEKTGVKVLKNETDSIMVGTTPVDVFGVLTSNPSAFWNYAGESFQNYLTTATEHLKITAVHEPFIFEEFSVDSWGDIMVCGHTHGGVVRVPVLGPLYTYEGGLFPEKNDDYVYGRHNVAGRPLIVSSGLENMNVFRINNQPEIVIVDVNKF